MNPKILNRKELKLDVQSIILQEHCRPTLFEIEMEIETEYMLSAAIPDLYEQEQTFKENNDLNNFSQFRLSIDFEEEKENQILSVKTNQNQIEEAESPSLSKLKHFNNLVDLLSDIFQGKKISSPDLNFTLKELSLIKSILVRKFFKTKYYPFLENSNQTLSDFKNSLIKLIDELNKVPVLKRTEEFNKFIYKLTLKLLRNNFYLGHNLKHNKDNEVLFYKFYFEDNSIKTGVPLKEYHDPLNVKEIKRCLNNQYLFRIFNNAKFKDNFMRILLEDLKESYIKSLSKKFDQLFLRYEKMIKIKNKETALEDIHRNLKNKKRFKFPWTLLEVDLAIEHFKNHVENILNA